MPSTRFPLGSFPAPGKSDCTTTLRVHPPAGLLTRFRQRLEEILPISFHLLGFASRNLDIGSRCSGSRSGNRGKRQSNIPADPFAFATSLKGASRQGTPGKEWTKH